MTERERRIAGMDDEAPERTDDDPLSHATFRAMDAAAKAITEGTATPEQKRAWIEWPGRGTNGAVSEALLRQYAAALLRDPEPGEGEREIMESLKPHAHKYLSLVESYRMLTKVFGEVQRAHITLSRSGLPVTGSAIDERVQSLVEPAPREAEGAAEGVHVCDSGNCGMAPCEEARLGHDPGPSRAGRSVRTPEPVQPESDGELRERIAWIVGDACADYFDGPTDAVADRILALEPLASLRARVEELERELRTRIRDWTTLRNGYQREAERATARAEAAEREVERLESYEAAYNDTSSRLDEAQAYASRHIGARALGRNVWHALLDDAIRLRALSPPDTREEAET